MKQYFKNIIIFSISVILFVSCPFSVYASDHGGSGGTDHNPDFITDSGTINVKDDGVVMYYIEYILANVGAVLRDHDLSKAMANDQTMKEYISKGKFDANTNTVTFPKETVTYVYNTFNTIAKENEPYYMVNTLTLSHCAGNSYSGSKLAYDTAKNLLEDSPSGIIAFGFYYSKPTRMFFADVGHDFTNVSSVKKGTNDLFITFYNNESWNFSTYTGYEINLSLDDEAIKTAEEFKEKSVYTYQNKEIGKYFRVYPEGNSPSIYPYDCRGANGWLNLITKESRRIRVFNTYGDFQNYTLGKRNVYYTSKYYNYVPEDLTTSIDDLQQTVDDLSGVIDKLLGQITENTDESEIEDILKQILDELKNNQGSGGGGGGSGGGDVNVDIDLSSTNTLLSKILAKVTQIFDNLQSGGSEGTGGNILQESLDALFTKLDDLNTMLKKYLSEITGDLDDIKGQLENMSEQEFTEKTGDFLDDTMAEFSEIGEKAKTKFPFSIPNDIKLLISKMSVSPPEDGIGGDSGIYNMDLMTVDNAGGGLITVAEGDTEDIPIISETGAPVFYLPFVIESAGINEYVKIDLSGFDSVSKFCRSLLTIWFILCLYNLTFKVIGLWGDLVD